MAALHLLLIPRVTLLTHHGTFLIGPLGPWSHGPMGPMGPWVPMGPHGSPWVPMGYIHSKYMLLMKNTSKYIRNTCLIMKNWNFSFFNIIYFFFEFLYRSRGSRGPPGRLRNPSRSRFSPKGLPKGRNISLPKALTQRSPDYSFNKN